MLIISFHVYLVTVCYIRSVKELIMSVIPQSSQIQFFVLNQGFLLVRLKSSLRKFYGRHYDVVNRYGISVSLSQWTTYMFHLS